MTFDPRLDAIVEAQPYPLLFVTLSGAHLYGFPSPDSDYDLRGSHILPPANVLRLDPSDDTLQVETVDGGLEIDLVTHDVHKYFHMVLKRNGYVLEQIFSPLILCATPAHDALKQIARDCITRHHVHHYLGFADTQWRLFSKESPPRVKPLLYVFRVLLTGIHLMRTGEVEANLITLNDTFKLPYIPDLITRKLAGAERGTLDAADMGFYRAEYERLIAQLETAHAASTLPEVPNGYDALNKLLLDLRLQK
jgi:uncharacterized protein